MKLTFPKVLVIDDDAAFREALSRWLSELGYAPSGAASAVGGVALLDQGDFEAILLDLQLPDVSGHAIIRQLNNAGITVPVIVVSGTAEMDDVVRAWRRNAADFLRKPFRLEDLSTALDKALRRDLPESASSAPEPEHAPPKQQIPRVVEPPHPSPKRRTGVRPAVARLKEELRKGTVTIPILDPKVAAIQAFLTRDDYHIQEVSDTVGRDGALTAGVLRAANTAYYARGASVNSLRDACVRIGPRRVIGVALEVAVQNQFRVPQEPFRTILQALWQNSIVTSRVAGAIARAAGRDDSDDLQIAALLHNIGELLCVRLFSELDGGNDALPLAALADEIANIHEDFGMALATSWGLPASIIRIAGHHHRPVPGREPGDHTTIRHLVLAAWAMALAAGFTYLPGQDAIDPEPFLNAVALERALLDQIGQDLKTWEL